MGRVLPPAASVRPVASGAVGGVLAAGVALVVAAAMAGLRGHAPVAVANGVGAGLVRWLQLAAPQALDNFYPDATLGGLVLALVLGSLVGAVAGGVWARMGPGNAMVWGLGLGVGLWVLVRWGAVPALDPVLGVALDAVTVAGACLAFGFVLGWWLGAVRSLDAASAGAGQ
jgi:hypothetical protein